VKDYSTLNYQQLLRIANNDSIAASMSEEEYESLSSELWKKFRAEKRIAGSDSMLLSPTPDSVSPIRAVLNALRIRPAQETPVTPQNSQSASARRQQPSLFRSGD
jgi:hypothetical protein